MIFGVLLLAQCSTGTNESYSQTPKETCTVPPTYPASATNSLNDTMRNYSNYLPVFPSAQGFGTITPAGRGLNPCQNAPEVVVVSNLNSTGTGSLRAALEGTWQKPRFVVFQVGGTIDLAVNGKHQAIKITSPYVTIAGQTAPSPSITLKNGTIKVSTHDVLIQHLRMRPGNETCVNIGDCDHLDGLSISRDGSDTNPNDVYNVVIDHSSISWGVDETAESWSYNGQGRVSDITISNSIISNGLDGKDMNSKGLLVGDYTKRISLLGNIFAHNRNRNPVLQGDVSGLIANNIIYNKGWEAIALIDGYGNGPSLISIVGNVVIPGPSTGTGSFVSKGLVIYDTVKTGTKVFVSDNVWNWQRGQTLSEQWSMFVKDYNLDVNEQVDTVPVWISPFKLKQSSQVMTPVLASAGVFPRDNIDARVVDNIINCPQGKNHASCPADFMNQGDFMKSPPPNAWVTSTATRSLRQAATVSNCPLPASNKYWLDKDGDGYTNFEEWLHAMATYVEKGQKCGS